MKIQSFLVCDDVRLESGGKTILIGIYETSIMVAANTNFPVKLPTLSFFCRFKLDAREKIFDAVEIKYYMDEKVLYTVEGSITVKDFALPVTVYHTIPGFNLPGQGKLEIEIHLKSGNEVIETFRPGSIFIETAAPQLT